MEKLQQAAVGYPTYPAGVPQKMIETKRYVLRFASTPEELRCVQQLRAKVFYNDPMGLDEDQFDAVFHHLLVLDRESDEVVGTYRMQTAEMAHQHDGFFASLEYVLDDFPIAVLNDAVEIGRVCVDEHHRNGRVLHLLWRGLALYLEWNKKRYLFGCASLFSQDVRLGYAALDCFKKEGHVHDSIWVHTQPAYTCLYEGSLAEVACEIPKLLKVYINFGAKICSPPGLDREFKTIDFLVLFDLQGLSKRAYESFFGG